MRPVVAEELMVMPLINTFEIEKVIFQRGEVYIGFLPLSNNFFIVFLDKILQKILIFSRSHY
jgi:hypothetical protein